MPKTNYIKATVGKETEEGTAIARAAVIPISGLPALNKAATKQLDPAITGAGMDTGNILASYSVGGSLPLAFRPCRGIGHLMSSLLGDANAPVQVGGCVKLTYTGAQDSCKIVANTTADTLVSSVGDLGAESADAVFGTAGSLDLTAGTVDTIAELASVINAYTGYSAEVVWGSGDIDSANIVNVTSQAKGRYVYLFFTSADSGVYLHRWDVDLTEDERPTLSIQIDGRGDNYLYNGNVVSALSLSAALQGMVEAEATVMGFDEVGSQTASVLEMPDVDPLMFGSGVSVINGVKFTFIKKLSLALANGHSDAGGYGQGSLGRQANLKGKFTVTGDFTLRLDSDALAMRPRTFDTTLISCQYEFYGKEIGVSIDEWVLIDLPFVGISENSEEDADGSLDISYKMEAFDAKGAQYDGPVSVFFLSTDSGAY